MKSQHRGSDVDDLLEEEGLLEMIEALAEQAVRDYESGLTTNIRDLDIEEKEDGEAKTTR